MSCDSSNNGIYVELDPELYLTRQSLIRLAQIHNRGGTSEHMHDRHKVFVLDRYGLHGYCNDSLIKENHKKVSVLEFEEAIKGGQEENMAKDDNKFNVYVELGEDSDSLRNLIIDLAIRNGKEGAAKWITNLHRFLYLGPQGDGVGLYATSTKLHIYDIKNYRQVDVAEFIRIIEEPIPKDPPIMVGDYEVEFFDNGIQVGCQFISHDIMQQIYDRCFKKDKENK